MLEKRDLQKIYLLAAIVAVLAGLVFSYGNLSADNMQDISSGMSGFIAGAILVGSGLGTCALVATRDVA